MEHEYGRNYQAERYRHGRRGHPERYAAEQNAQQRRNARVEPRMLAVVGSGDLSHSEEIEEQKAEEIEEYLENIDTIAESVIVGRTEEDTGETKLVAVIFPAYEKYPELSENDLRGEIQKSIAALNKKLPSFKQIHKLEFRKTEFEKTSSRKIKRHLVK